MATVRSSQFTVHSSQSPVASCQLPSISGRGQGSRLQASGGSQACSARSPGAAPPLTMLARRGIHSGRRPAVDRGRVGRSSIRRPRRFCQCDYYCFFSPEPSGKPAGPNGHTRRTASFHPRSGTRPLRGRMASPLRPGVETHISPVSVHVQSRRLRFIYVY